MLALTLLYRRPIFKLNDLLRLLMFGYPVR